MFHSSVFCVSITVFPDSDNLLFFCRTLLPNVYMDEEREYCWLEH
jgi:hypothetical protein